MQSIANTVAAFPTHYRGCDSVQQSDLSSKTARKRPAIKPARRRASTTFNLHSVTARLCQPYLCKLEPGTSLTTSCYLSSLAPVQLREHPEPLNLGLLLGQNTLVPSQKVAQTKLALDGQPDLTVCIRNPMQPEVFGMWHPLETSIYCFVGCLHCDSSRQLSAVMTQVAGSHKCSTGDACPSS
jgi:hypothetical protein